MKKLINVILALFGVVSVFCFSEKMTGRAWAVFVLTLLCATGLAAAVIFLIVCVGISYLP